MNIVHLSTYSFGGAGNAAIRLHQGLSLNNSWTSNFLCLENKSSFQHGITTVEKYFPNFFLQKINRFFPISQGHINDRILKKLSGDYEFLSFCETDYKFLSEHPLIKQADLIHLHWVANWIDFPSFFAAVNKPIVWTLHDMNPFKGLFHYDIDEVNIEKKLIPINDYILRVKYKAYQQSSLKCIVCPSEWIRSKSSESKLLGHLPHRLIPYGLNTNLFKYYSKVIAKSLFGIPTYKRVLLVVANNLNDRRKGLDLLLDALKITRVPDEFILVAIGYGQRIQDLNNFVFTGFLNDEKLMAMAYNLADAFILPTREDNLPNVMLESISCGTPVIATPVGGINDVIIDGFNGFIASELSAVGLANALKRFIDCEVKFNHEVISKHAHQNYNLEKQANSYIELYKEILG